MNSVYGNGTNRSPVLARFRLPIIFFEKGGKSASPSSYNLNAHSESSDNLVFMHSAFGAEKLRYSVDFGRGGPIGRIGKILPASQSPSPEAEQKWWTLIDAHPSHI